PDWWLKNNFQLTHETVLNYLLRLREALTPVIDVMQLSSIQKYNNAQWSNYIADLRGTLATFPGKKPAAIRIDQLDRRSLAGEPSDGILIYPLIVHMTYTPMKLSLTREPKYKSVLKNFMKLQYLMMNKPKITPTDRAQLAQLANELEDMEHSGVHRREITVELSSEGFYRTGIRPDISQHALNLVSLVSHLRFHKSLESLEKRLDYSFRDKSLLHQALTHPSYRRTNFGTNQDHFQNSLVSCGPRILEYGDKLQLYKAWRKKGLTKMIQVMSVLPKMHEERSNIYGNERLEFLGDAVIEVISSIHLFFMFPELPEGHLDAYRQAIVQNQHLAELAIRLGIHKFLLYTHSVDFCYDSTFIYARSDAFEALMAAIALDAGLDIVDRIFGAVLFGDEDDIHRVWVKIPPHPLQAQYPNGDRSWATKVPMLKKLPILEEDLGITFKHLRVLARAMTIRKTGFNFYTFGDNQRLEFLGDSLLKYVSTDYLFRHFPRHHEGHLSLLKNSLVNKYTQAAVCSELGLDQYVIRREDNSVLKPPGNGDSDRTGSGKPSPVATSLSAQNQNVKYKADLLEAFVGALFVDKDLVWVERFCQVCFWPRLVEFILKQEWNDAKSKLQQCCLTFRSLHEEPEIAHYKVLDHSGPTNQRTYLVGVYFRGQRLATGKGRSVQQAQMEAAKRALELHQDTFRQLDFQRSVISRRYRQPYIDKMLDHVQNWDERLVDYFIHGDKPGRESEKIVANDSPSNTAADFVQFLRQDPKRKGSDQLKLGETSHSESHSLIQSTASVRSARQSQAFTKSSKDRVCRRSLETGETGGAEMSQSVSECMSEEGEIQDEDEDMNDNETTDDDNETVNSNLGNRSRFRSVPNQNVALKDGRRRGADIESGNSGTKSRYRRSLPSGTLADLFTSRGTR
ncbi:Ribonuclease 3, partial [Fasciola gigantica]